MSVQSYDSDFTYSTKSSKNDPDLKNHLLKVLKEKGLVDNLKTQVRQSLIAEMAAKQSIFKMANTQQGKSNKDFNIINYACMSIIYEYLTKKGFQYTQSVFIPESSIIVDKLYSIQELLRILHIDIKSEFYKKLTVSLKDSDANFLTSLLKTLSDYHSCKNSEIEIQTEKPQSFIPLSEKLNKLELQFEDRQKQGILKNQQLYEDRIIGFQRDMEKRMRMEMENQMQSFKDREISVMKLKVEEQYNKLLKEKSSLLEEQYQNKLAALNDRERTSQENFQRYKESQDRENYLQRQQLLRDINNIQERELQNKKERERIEREFEMMKEQHQTKMDILDERNFKLKELEIGIEMRINQEVNSIKLDEEKRLIHKWKELEIAEMKLLEEKQYVEREKCSIEKVKEELTRRQCLFNEMEIINYPVLKQQNSSLQEQVEELKQQSQQQHAINEQDKHRINCLLKQKMSPSIEHSVLTNELERARDLFKREKSILEEQKESLEKRLLEEIKNKRIISDQYSKQQELVEMLTRQLSDHKEAFLNNKSGYISSRSQNNGFYSNRNIHTNRDLSPSSTNEFRRKFNNNDAGMMDYHQDIDECSLPIDIEDLTNIAKNKLMHLDEETDHINKAYQDFKNRLANSSVVFNDAPKTLVSGLNSHSFQTGFREGRNLKENMEFRNSKPVTSQNEQTFPAPFDSSFERIELNNTGLRHRKDFNENDYQRIDFPKDIDNDMSTGMETLVKVSSVSPRFSPDMNADPIVNFDKEFDHKKSMTFNPSSQNDKSDPINLAENWKQDIFASSEKTTNSLDEIDRDKKEKSLGNAVQEEDDIDPVVKKYMELVKNQKEAQQKNEVNVINNKNPLTDLEKEESDNVKSVSENTADLVSIRRESSSDEIESKSFW